MGGLTGLSILAIVVARLGLGDFGLMSPTELVHSVRNRHRFATANVAEQKQPLGIGCVVPPFECRVFDQKTTGVVVSSL